MDIKRILYVSHQIAPYISENEISVFGRALPQYIQEKGKEVRLFMPKFGCINERRNQLHEVIRLSGKNISINDVDHPLLIKVATLQPYRMQVYFIDNEDYFKRHSVKELETVLFPDDNDERLIFFTRSVAETAIKLRWIPQIIHCGGWISSLIPLYLRKNYGEDPTFANTKLVFSLFNDAFDGDLNSEMLAKLKPDGISELDIRHNNGRVDYVALCKTAIDYSDAIVQPSPDVLPELLEYAKASGKPFLPYYPIEEDAGKRYDEFYQSL